MTNTINEVAPWITAGCFAGAAFMWWRVALRWRRAAERWEALATEWESIARRTPQ